ncbi:MAG TPA: SRPBCC domain-containing protein [Kribbella sp.]|uniref:SRPBCC domain-containing protein n=1 Tax=Kribbella sp. TaxID=1871183 RepID=UPI002D782712|nr:SRPBCC domain-containing protein [Kribbella sp.]HET6298048.1 SRPBCC domain-containing protein [Kribbella sp.]
MEFGTIEREIRIEASPEVVFEVISSPEHLQEWWADEAELDSAPGGRGTLRWARGTDQEMVVPITVVEVEPPRLFSFRWVAPEGEAPVPGNSLLVTFEVVPSGAATVLRMTETGFREKGWEIAVLEEQYRDHGEGWDHYIPRLGEYVLRLVAPR